MIIDNCNVKILLIVLSKMFNLILNFRQIRECQCFNDSRCELCRFKTDSLRVLYIHHFPYPPFVRLLNHN